MDWVLLHLAEPEVRGVHWPLVGTLLLLSGVVVLVRLQVELPDFFGLGHVFSGVDGLLGSPLVVLRGETEPKPFLLSLPG